ncbi:MAG: alkaline phosphatase family protein [Dehalococcoidia bacterium]
MNDIDRVQSWFESGTLLRADAGVANTVDLARALASIAGGDVELAAGATNVRDAIGETEHLVFVLIDGLGMNLIESLPAGSFLRDHVAIELRAVFPATTAAALTSLATGLWPAQHAVPAWWTYLPQYKLTTTILPFNERFSERPLAEFGVRSEDVFCTPAMMASFRRDTLSFMPRQLAGSVYTRYVSGGTPISGYTALRDAIDGAIARVERAASATYTYIYYPAVDTLEHIHGPASDHVRNELDRVESELARLARAIAGRGRVAVSADHGVLAVAQKHKYVIEADDPLLEPLVAPPYGEPRVPFFRVRDGASDAFTSRFRERYGEEFALLSIDEADELRLFGPEPLSTATRGRIGDYIAVPEAARVLVHSSVRDKHGPGLMRGFHGGMLREEMRIPLVVA